jgi:peptide deformylase
MAVFPIRTFGDPVLGLETTVVTEVDASIRRLVDDMLETMYDAPGVGLAAPQIGIPKAVMVFDAGEGPFAIINPQIVETSGEWTFDEGCLSVPGHFWPISRPAFARVRGLDAAGDPVEHSGDEMLGRVLQHEVDHLNGILLLKRLTRRERRQAMREIRGETLGL